MQDSAVPTKFPIYWAQNAAGGQVRRPPFPSQIGIQNGAASFNDGFPPLTFTPVASGGIPPFGQDMNGVMEDVTQWLQWFQAGGPVYFDATFSSNVGGYPKGAVLASNYSLGLLWVSLVDNNTTNPDSGTYTNNWLSIGPALYRLSSSALTVTSQHNGATFLANTGAIGFMALPAPSTLKGLGFRIVTSGGTAAFTMTTASGVFLGRYGSGSASMTMNQTFGFVFIVVSDGVNWDVQALTSVDDTNSLSIPGDLSVLGNTTLFGFGLLGSGARGSGNASRIVNLGDFSSSWSGPLNGYTEDPQGVFDQTFAVGAPYSGAGLVTTNFTLPLAYPNATLDCAIWFSGNTPPLNGQISVDVVSRTTISITTNSTGGVVGPPVYGVAVRTRGN